MKTQPAHSRAYELLMGLLGILFIVSAVVMLAVGGVIVFSGTALLALGRRLQREDRS